MSTFGDYEPDDATDTAPPDPEAVARLWHLEARRVTRDDRRPTFDELHPHERAMWVFVLAALLARLRREGGL